MKALYKLHFDCGRNGELYGLFVAEKDDMDELMDSGDKIYFGEVLGKHSEVMGPIEDCDVTFITSDEKVIAVVEHYKLEVGFNPFHYDRITDDDLEDEE